MPATNFRALLKLDKEIKRCAQFWLKLILQAHPITVPTTVFQNVILAVAERDMLKCRTRRYHC